MGLCDIGERRYFEGAIDTYFVCDPDLEGELIRALGVDRVEEVVESLGDLAQLRVFQRQPFQRDRPAKDQLRRFMGTMSGRKAKYATALVEALETRAPQPLLDLLESI